MKRDRLLRVGLIALWLLPWCGGCSSEPEKKPPKPSAGKSASKAKSTGKAKIPAKDKLAAKPKPAAPKIKPEDNRSVVDQDPKTHLPYDLDLGNGLHMEFVWIPSGAYMMGDPNQGLPRQRVKIEKPFYMAKYEVTQEQWEFITGKNPSLNRLVEGNVTAEEIKKRPVERVQWDDVQEFLKTVNEKYAAAPMRFDLPTEAQWEWAARAGYSMRTGASDDPDKIPDYAWYGGNSNRETHPVGAKKANDWGLFDMHGNVAEFCKDVASKEDPGRGEVRVVRGGNWQGGATECSSTARVIRAPKVPLRYDGLRLIGVPK